jgi:hypothetical protein
MPDEPNVLVAWTRLTLGEAPDDVRARVLAAVGPEVREALDSAGRMGRIHVRHHMSVGYALRDELGLEAFRALYSATLQQSTRGPLFRRFVDGMTRLFGATPEALLRAWPRAWPYVFGGGGRVEIDLLEGEARAVAQLVELPPEFRDPLFAEGVAGAFRANYEVLGLPGSVELDATELSEGRMTLHMQWGR